MARGFALFAGTTPEIIRASAREAEALGYSSFWVNHPGSVDGLAALAFGARETKRIELGIGVIPLHTRGPFCPKIACSAATVKSQKYARWLPPPTAYPFTRAITGLEQRDTVR